MEKVRPWCGQPSDRGRLRNRTEQVSMKLFKTYDINTVKTRQSLFSFDLPSVIIEKRANNFKDGL